jgi:DNA-binding XRE family transcriptional regulator
MNIEVRAVGLKAMREKRGLTQRKLAHELGISQNLGIRENYVPAEAGARRAWPRLQRQLAKCFTYRFEDLFEVVLVARTQRLSARSGPWRSGRATPRFGVGLRPRSPAAGRARS